MHPNPLSFFLAFLLLALQAFVNTFSVLKVSVRFTRDAIIARGVVIRVSASSVDSLSRYVLFRDRHSLALGWPSFKDPHVAYVANVNLA